MKSNDVFISYSTRNTQTAQIVRKLFQDHGITCWMAPESIPAGSNYTKEIPYGILYSKIAVLILSNASLNSIWVNHEIEYLLSAEHPVIPFLVEDISMNPMQNNMPFSEVIMNNASLVNLENSESFQRLLSIVQHQLGKVSTARIPDTSDDLLQLGMKDISEDGGTLVDDGKAEYYLTRSAELGNPVAMRYLARLIYDNGDADEAQEWWTKAASGGDIPAIIHNVYKLLSDSEDYIFALQKATETLKEFINEDNQEANCLYAQILLKTENPYFNPSTAHTILERCLDNGYKNAAIHLGDIYHYSIGAEEDPDKAFMYYEIASSSDDFQLAFLKLADCFYEGYGTEKNMIKAFQLYGDFCFYSNEYIEKYADCWNYGYGTQKNKDKAIEMYRMIVLDDDCNKIIKSEVQRRVLDKRLALNDRDVFLTMANLMYSLGEYDSAFNLYNKSVEDNNPESLFGLALCYLNGHGTKYDYKKAFYLFSKSYSLKYKKAAEYLSQCYKYGIGTTKNQNFADYFNKVDEQDADGIWSISIM